MATEQKSDKPANYVILTVQAAADGEFRLTAAGKPMASLRAFKGQGKDRESGAYKPSLWFTVKSVDKQPGDAPKGAGAVLANARKGERLTVKGQLALEEWTGRDEAVHQTLVIWAVSAEPFQPEGEEAVEDLDDEP